MGFNVQEYVWEVLTEVACSTPAIADGAIKNTVRFKV